MKKIVYLINIILVTASCTIPSLKAVDNTEEQWDEAKEILFLCLNNDKDVTCAQCKNSFIPDISRNRKNNEEAQALIQSECLYCSYFKVHSNEKRYLLVDKKYKFHTSCYTTLSESIKHWLKNTDKNSRFCTKCRKNKEKPALKNQNLNRKHEAGNCDPDFAECLCKLLCLPCLAAAN